MKWLKQKEHYYTLSARNEPVLSIEPGETVHVETLDNVAQKIKTEKDPIPTNLPFNPVSGPIYVKGAKKGDTLTVDIKEIKLVPKWNQGWIGQTALFGACLAGSDTNPVLWGTQMPNRVKICRIKNGKVYFPIGGQEIAIPFSPMIGTIGTAPERAEVSSLGLGNFGGNMDSPDCCVGNKLYLPIFVEGALLHLGDVHAAQGDGELGGPAVEIPARCTLAIDLIKGKTIRWPRIESSDYIMTVGNVRPLDDAVRVAAVEMISMLKEDYGFDLWDASMLATAVVKIVVNECTNPLYSITVKFPKKYLLK